MKIRRASAAIAMAATGALLFSACNTPGGGQAEPTETSGSGTVEPTDGCKADLGDVETAEGEIKYSIGEDEWHAYNNDTGATNSTYNTVVNTQLFSGFYYFGSDGTICHDENFGSYEAVSEDPLVVEYTINEDAVWSDGEPIAYEDYLLDWATQYFQADGKPTVDGTEEPLFDFAGGMTLGTYVTTFPEGEVGGKTVTYNYDRVYADWEAAVSDTMPAHIVAEKAGTDVAGLVDAIKTGNVDILTKAAEFWNTGWAYEPGDMPPAEDVPSSGPYILDPEGWTAGQAISVIPNEAYWGPAPATSKLTFRFAAPETHVQALSNGDLNAIEPQATVDTVTQLEALGDSVTVSTGQEFTWEHVDFNFASGRPFAEDQGGLALREAFALCFPRQKIVDDLIKPINPDAVVMNAREVFPFQDAYADVIEASYGGEYDEVDIEASKAKIAESGLTTPIDVEISYNAPNERRSQEVALIKSSCDEAGFNIVDGGSEAFFDSELSAGDWDIALFAWAGSGLVASGQSIYSNGGGQNYGKYESDAVTEAWTALADSADPEVHLEQQKILETELWKDLHGMPIFAHPGVAAYSSELQNVRQTVAQNGLPWNAEQWSMAS
ncbi:ABC transporter substrate-binding protein [Antribacter gilvus]|uniref:ABC transporter substrate-binding protein n=1 Tax=Antribacter gilvus TaxID=2304675 RepID=UPI000F7843F4|nr:ABC transporter substrate-binding protein [Antribacter gilvus]